MGKNQEIEKAKFEDIFRSNIFETKEFQALKRPKIEISKYIRDTLEQKDLSLRKVANLIDEMNIDQYKASYTQIARVTSCENYNINTLLKILDVLGLELAIRPKQADKID